MSDRTNNPFITFYSAHNISPVHQDISNLNLHLKRRTKLYMMLGLPPAIFSGRTILEVGPGGGYNALALFNWGANMDFVEPNPKAQEELPILLNKHGIDKKRWSLYRDKVENYFPEKKYDLVIAEGFLPGLYDREEVIGSLARLANRGGVIVVTCVDDISVLLEIVRRLVATRLIRGITGFEEKVKILSRAFSTHLSSLKYASRPVEDWVTDQFINPALYANLFSIADCIEEFGDSFEFLGSSPSMITDLTWYKDVDVSRRELILKQFYSKRHNLLYMGLEDSVRPAEENKNLFEAAYELRTYAAQIGDELNDDTTNNLVKLLKNLSALTNSIDAKISDAINEAAALISDPCINEIKVAQSHKLAKAFGRGMQYVSLVKLS